jgi:hypothetical protein
MKKAGIFEGKAIGPVKSEKASSKAKDAMKRILSSKVKLGKVTIRELVDDGRRY